MAGFIKLYTALLRFYPRQFQAEFGEEMQAVFAEAAANQSGGRDAFSLFLRELRDLPASLIEAYAAKMLQKGNVSMNEATISPSTRWQAFWGMLPFLAYGISTMIGKMDHIQGHYAVMVVYAITLVGLLIGWVRGFPLWSYSYLGWSLLLGWQYTNIKISGFRWGYQVWIPFGITVLIALLWTRSLAPIKKFLRDCWNDWSRLLLAMFTLGAWMFLVYDENHHPYLLLFILAATVIASAGAWFFLRSSSVRGRVFAIIASFIAAVILGGTSYLTWDWRAYYGLPPAENWIDGSGLAPIGVLFWLVILFWPALIALIHRIVNRRTA